MARISTIGVVTAFLISTLMFQNCSEVGFSEGTQSLKADINDGGKHGFDEEQEEAGADSEVIDVVVDVPVTDVEDDILGEVIGSNGSCDALFNSGGMTDLAGSDFTSKGISPTIKVKNGGDLTFAGMADSLTVNGSKSVQLKGIYGEVCLKSESFDLKGILGTSGTPVVLIGEGNNAKIEDLSGIQPSDLVLINISSIDDLTGINSDTYIHGGHVKSIKGVGKDLYLMGGTHVEELKGIFRSVYLSGGATIGSKVGIANIIQLD